MGDEPQLVGVAEVDRLADLVGLLEQVAAEGEDLKELGVAEGRRSLAVFGEGATRLGLGAKMAGREIRVPLQ